MVNNAFEQPSIEACRAYIQNSIVSQRITNIYDLIFYRKEIITRIKGNKSINTSTLEQLFNTITFKQYRFHRLKNTKKTQPVQEMDLTPGP